MRSTFKRSLALVAFVAFFYGLANSAGILSVYFGGTGSDLSATTPLHLIKKDATAKWVTAATTGAGATGPTGPTGVVAGTAPIVATASDLSCPSCAITGTSLVTSTSGVVAAKYSANTGNQFAPWGGETGTTSVELIGTAYSPFAGTTVGLYVTLGVAQTTGGWTALRLTYPSPSLQSLPIYPGVSTLKMDIGYRYNNDSQPFHESMVLGVVARNWGSTVATIPVGITSNLVTSDGATMLSAPLAATSTVAASGTVTIVPNANYASTRSGFPVPFAGTVSNFCFNSPATIPNSGTAPSFTIMDNGAASGVTFTIPINTVLGHFCDKTNTRHLDAGDRVAARIINNTAGTLTFGAWSAKFAPDSGTAGFFGSAFLTAASGTQYWPIVGTTATATSILSAVYVPRAGTVTRLCVSYDGATASGHVFTLQRNGSDTSLVLTTTTDGAAGSQCATDGRGVGFSLGDRINLKSVYTSGNENWDMWSINF